MYLILAESALSQFGAYVVEAYLVQFVDSNGDVDQPFRCANHFRDSSQHLAVVDFDRHADAQLVEHHVDHLHQFQLVEQRGAADHVGITLVEFAIAPLLRTVGAPHRLQLVAAEGEGDLVAVLHHKACKWHSQVVAQSAFTDLRSHFVVILVEVDTFHEVAAVEHFEQQLVALFAVLAHQGAEVLHRRSLNGLESKCAEHRANGVENVVAPCHLCGQEVARSFWN